MSIWYHIHFDHSNAYLRNRRKFIVETLRLAIEAIALSVRIKANFTYSHLQHNFFTI